MLMRTQVGVAVLGLQYSGRNIDEQVEDLGAKIRGNPLLETYIDINPNQHQ